MLVLVGIFRVLAGGGYRSVTVIACLRGIAGMLSNLSVISLFLGNRTRFIEGPSNLRFGGVL